MKNTNKYINMWYASIVCICAGLASFVIGMYVKEIYMWAFCVIMFVAFTVMFVVSNKHLTLEAGYTVIQAMTFYKECRKAGIKKNYRPEIALEVAKKLDFAKSLTELQVRELYQTGEKYVRQRGKK